VKVPGVLAKQVGLLVGVLSCSKCLTGTAAVLLC